MRKFFLLFGLLFAILGNAQVIKGTVLCNHETVPFASITIKDTNNSIITYAFSDEKGSYAIALTKPIVEITIEVQSMAHEPLVQKWVIKDPKQKEIQINLDLKERITVLKEVLITTKENFNRRKKDTLSYDLSKYKDGSERVVQDVLKKLPGIKVDNKGLISFNGKPIKKMLLDGDDLFDANYTIGSKNIDADMIDGVQAINHFNENKLLHGINDSQDVALNLTLKKNKSDYSGNLELGYAYEDKKKVNGVVLQINSKMKSFVTASYNNVGNNFSPYDYQSGMTSLETRKDSDFHAKELLNQGSLNSELEDKYHRMNNNFYTSLNSVASLSKKTKLKYNFDFYKDRLQRQNETETSYILDNQSFNVNTVENIRKSPVLYNLGYQLNHSFTDSLQIEYIGKLEYQKINLNEATINNSIQQFNTTQTDKSFVKQIINLSKRIDKKSALLSSLFFSRDSAPQEYVLSPGFDISNQNLNDNPIQNNQKSKFVKQYLSFKTEYIFKHKNLILNSSANYNYITNDFNSTLKQFNNQVPDDLNPLFQNHSNYKVSTPSISSNFSYIKSSYEIRGSLTAQYLHFSSNDYFRNTSISEQGFVIAPKASVSFDVGRYSKLILDYSLDQSAPDETNYFEGLVLVNYRNFIKNDPSFKILTKQEFKLIYGYDKLYSFQKARLNFTYGLNKNNFFSKNYIEEQYNVTTSFLMNSGNHYYSFGCNLDKYLDVIRTGFELESNYTNTFGKNIVNNSDLRDIESRNLLVSLKIVPRLGIKMLYIDNKTSVTTNAVLLESNLTNKISSFKNSTKMLIRIKERFRSETICNVLIQDLNQNYKMVLLDSELTFSSKNKRIDYSIIGRNLANLKSFTTFTVSDFSTASYSHSLFSRFILGSVSFQF